MADRLSPRSNSAGPREPAPTLDPPPAQRLSKRRALLELALGYSLILIVLWTSRPWQRPLYLLAVIVIAAIVWTSFTSAQAMGLRTTNFLRSSWIAAVALLMAAVAINIAIRLHTLHPLYGPIAFLKRYWGYALWAFIQQLLLQDFFLRRLLCLLPSAGLAALTAATIFSIAHLPSPILTLATFTLGLAACLLFLRYRNLYPLAIAHAILGVTLAITLPNPIIRNMRVGLGYLTYTQHDHHDHRSHIDHVVSTSAWVIAEAPTLRSWRHARP
jgi:membrane protease YdiL (CAAX protease family)